MSETWADHLDRADLEDARDPGGPVVIVSAHPDDEVLAVGAWLAAQVRREVTFVTATDGEASHPGSPSIDEATLRVRRRAELLTALDRLGFVSPRIVRLELPDSGLHDHRADLEQLLAPHVSGASLILAPYAHDGHSDHDAVGSAVVAVAAAATVWQFPIWTWAWTAPATHVWHGSPQRLPSGATQRAKKLRAIDAFETQVGPLSDDPADAAVVDGVLLEHARNAVEVVIT